MAKRLRKSEKLDLILSELSQVRADLAKLLKRQSEGADPIARARRRSVRAKPAKKVPAKKGHASRKVGAKPGLVEVPSDEQPQVASRRA
jgi:hypothetical protein